jgi:hypothetical protein
MRDEVLFQERLETHQPRSPGMVELHVAFIVSSGDWMSSSCAPATVSTPVRDDQGNGDTVSVSSAGPTPDVTGVTVTQDGCDSVHAQEPVVLTVSVAVPPGSPKSVRLAARLTLTHA